MLSSPLDPAVYDNVVTVVRTAAADIIGAQVNTACQLERGGNNVTLLVKTARDSFVAKHYPIMPGDGWDRLFAESAGLRFLNAAGVSAVPLLVGSDAKTRVAVMTECGVPADCVAKSDDIEACVTFAKRLHEIRTLAGAESIPLAAEACLAANDVVSQVVARRQRLDEVSASYPELARFLADVFDPALSEYRQRSKAALCAAGISPDERLPRQWQTLSPSDFGLHNAVRGEDKCLTFVDFEYFGWDDPVRLVSDFLLHPGHQLDNDVKRQFIDGCCAIFSGDPNFLNRFRALYGLIGLRWCMILLNQFLPERMARRRAAGCDGQRASILTGQLRKADTLLTSLEKSKGVLIY